MTHLFKRLLWAKANLDPVPSDYRVVFDIGSEKTCSVLVPDPNWMACALYGDILPPVEVYSQLVMNEEGQITNGHILHEDTIGPMTEEEAIEYLIKKEIPAEVWQDETSNRPRFLICSKDQLPNRNYRNAWSIAA